ncbi:MAG: hypothetical protein ACTSWZ_07650 [Candidatus Heimdallarchaeaceae archaeon]
MLEKFKKACEKVGGTIVERKLEGLTVCKIGTAEIGINKKMELEAFTITHKQYPNVAIYFGGSNKIRNIALHKNTGELLIRTDKHTISGDKGLIEIGIDRGVWWEPEIEKEID